MGKPRKVTTATAAAVEMNRRRWERTTKAERSASARKAARARWKKHRAA